MAPAIDSVAGSGHAQSNQWLKASLDAGGEPSGYEAVDSTDILAGL